MNELIVDVGHVLLLNDVPDQVILNTVGSVRLGGRAQFTPEMSHGTAFCTLVHARKKVMIIAAISVSDGIVRWEVPLGDYVGHSPVAVGDALYVGTSEGAVVCLSQDKGMIIWTQQVSAALGGVHCPMTATENLVLVGTYGGEVVALDLATGEQRWRFPCPEERPEGIVTSKPIVWHDSVLFCDWLTHLHCLDLKTGHEKWRLNVGNAADYHHMDPLLVDDLLFLPGQDGWMRALDLVTREFAWIVDGDYHFRTHTPVAVGGVIYYRNDEDHRVWGYSTHPSSTLMPDYVIALETGYREPYELSVREGRIYCPSGPWLYVIEPRPATGIPTEYRIRKYKAPHRFVTGLAHDGDLFCAGIATDKLLIGRLPDASTSEESHSR